MLDVLGGDEDGLQLVFLREGSLLYRPAAAALDVTCVVGWASEDGKRVQDAYFARIAVPADVAEENG